MTTGHDGDKGKTLTRAELIRRTADKAKMSLQDAKKAIQHIEEVIFEALGELESVRLQGIGTLKPIWRGGSVIRSPHNRKRMFLDGRWSVGFRASQTVKSALAAQTPAHFRDEQHQQAWRLAETLVADLAAYHPDEVPVGVAPDSSDAEVRGACEAAFPGNWTRAASTWATQTPERITAERDHLAAAARMRWGTPSSRRAS